MVRGFSIAVMRVPGRYQWADMHTIAFGFAVSRPIRDHASVNEFCWIAFIGFPWPKKMAGMRMRGSYPALPASPRFSALGPRSARDRWAPALLCHRTEE